jgi:hypothetical protein
MSPVRWSRFVGLGIVGLLAAACESPVAPVEGAGLTPAVVDADAPTEISIRIAPNSLVLGVEGTWVTVHTSVRYGSALNSTLELSGIPASLAYADDRGFLVVKFSQRAVEAIVAPPSATLTLTGLFNDGAPFYGTGTIKVILRRKGGRC